MRQFKDTAQRDWTLEINLPTRNQIKKDLSVDLFAVFDGGLQKELADPEKLVNVLFLLCKAQADKLGITDVQFGTSFDGDVIEAASEALIESVIDFFPSRQRDLMRKALAKGKAQVNREIDLIMAELDKPLPPPTLSAPSTAPPDSPA